MIREIIAEFYPWESRIAVVEDGRLAEVFWCNQEENVGNTYKGKVKDILPGLSCAFIDIGLNKNAFLYAGDVLYAGQEKDVNAFDLLKKGQEIMVQVKKEAFSEKGARVTGALSLPGHFLVLLPYQTEISISRKITGDQRRQHLRTIITVDKPAHVGIIVRTACRDAEDEEIMDELRHLLKIWEDIRCSFKKAKAPCLIYEDIDVMERTLRDYLDGEISRVVINNPLLMEKVTTYLGSRNYGTRVPVYYEEGGLFEKYGLEKDIRRAIRRKVWLKSGGYLIFDETEAMTVIDVNSGKFTGKADFGETIFKLNLEAAEEIPRQLRLRSIGGIVIIDFVDMKNEANRDEIINALKRSLEKDKAHTRIIGLTGLGLLEMTRKKSRYGISEFFTDECNTCNGRGRNLNLFALTCEIKRKLINMGYLENQEIICEAHPDLSQMLAQDDENLEYIKRRMNKKITMVSNPDLSMIEYKIYTIDH